MRSAVVSLFIGRACLALFAAVAAAICGCGEEQAGCARVARCDVREQGCQLSVMEAMACLRGGRGDDLPDVRVISEDEFIERIRAYGADDPETQAEREAEYARWSRGLALFELAPAAYAIDDAVADSASETAAAYFHDEREIVIIDRGEPLDADEAVEVFAHEIVHALQDEELDLSAYEERWGTSFDAALALLAMIEGEAVHYQILAAVQLAGRSPDDLDWERLYTQWRADTLRDAEADEAPVALADMRFPYAFGGGLVSERWLERGRAGIEALLREPPRTSSEVLFGTSRRELVAEQDTLSEHAVPALPEPFVESAATALGAWIARMYAVRTVDDAGLRSRPAQELGADMFSVQHDAQSDVLVAAWRTRTLEGASALDWPAPASPDVIGEIDTADREAYALAADPQLPPGADMLAWRAAAEPEEQDEEVSAATAAWRLRLGLGHHRACALRRPPF